MGDLARLGLAFLKFFTDSARIVLAFVFGVEVVRVFHHQVAEIVVSLFVL